jgi:hypothetical protein
MGTGALSLKVKWPEHQVYHSTTHQCGGLEFLDIITTSFLLCTPHILLFRC